MQFNVSVLRLQRQCDAEFLCVSREREAHRTSLKINYREERRGR